jgi:ORF6N domain
MAGNSDFVVIDKIKTVIVPARGHKVVLDRDLAKLYGVDTRTFNQAIKRNLERFPADFMFQLDKTEQAALAGAFTHLKTLKFSGAPPYAFTEHGAIMAASVLSSPRAVEVSVLVVRAFVKLRELLFTHKELAKKFNELESRLANHDVAIQQLLHAIHQLMDDPPAPPKPKIGFRA